MANKKTKMSKVRKCILLHHQGQTKSFISKYLYLSRNTVKKYINLYKVLNLDINTIRNKSDEDLEKILSKGDTELSSKLQAVYNIFPYMEKELKRTGVTKQLIWEEYIAKYSDGLRSSRFMERYNVWSKKVNQVMHMNHKSGDKMYIDYAGIPISRMSFNLCNWFIWLLGSSILPKILINLSPAFILYNILITNVMHKQVLT